MIEQTPTIEQSPQIPAPEAPTATAQAPPVTQAPSLANDARRRSPFLAAALSTMPGLGQIYLGYYQLGFINIIVFAGVIALLTTGQLGPLIPLASIFLAFFWLYNIIDAGRRAVMVNEALAGRSSIQLPEDYSSPGLKGSVLGGSILVLAGVVLLAQTLFDVSLAWVEDWWPIAIVIFGAFLIYKARTDKATKPETDSNED